MGKCYSSGPGWFIVSEYAHMKPTYAKCRMSESIFDIIVQALCCIMAKRGPRGGLHSLTGHITGRWLWGLS